MLQCAPFRPLPFPFNHGEGEGAEGGLLPRLSREMIFATLAQLRIKDRLTTCSHTRVLRLAFTPSARLSFEVTNKPQDCSEMSSRFTSLLLHFLVRE